MSEPTSAPNPTAGSGAGGQITSYDVTGMTCGHCAAAVTEELMAVPGVGDVRVDLSAGGTSRVHVGADRVLDAETVQAALSEAGDYRLA